MIAKIDLIKNKATSHSPTEINNSFLSSENPKNNKVLPILPSWIWSSMIIEIYGPISPIPRISMKDTNMNKKSM